LLAAIQTNIIVLTISTTHKPNEETAFRALFLTLLRCLFIMFSSKFKRNYELLTPGILADYLNIASGESALMLKFFAVTCLQLEQNKVDT